MNATALLSRPVEVSDIGPVESHYAIDATAVERAEIASAFGLEAISSLTAELVMMIRPRAKVIELSGRINAAIIQNCVVSLEPVEQTIDEPIAASFVEEGVPMPKSESLDVIVDPVQEDPPETLTGPVIDLGAVVLEYLDLAIDPYPRRPGAEMPENPAKAIADDGDSPFAVLRQSGRRNEE